MWLQTPSRNPGVELFGFHSPDTRLGSARSGSFASLRNVLPDRKRTYVLPMKLRPNEWALAGDWRMEDDSSVLSGARGKVAYQIQAHHVHLTMGAKTHGAAIPFRVTLDGKAPGGAHGADVDADGFGLLDEQRAYF